MLSNNELILFHGTNQLFYEVDLEKSKNKRDFGKGFYTTTLELQSKSWAENMFIRYGGDGIYYEDMALKQLKFSKSNNQVSLHTSKALSRLEFIGRDEYDKQIFI